MWNYLLRKIFPLYYSWPFLYMDISTTPQCFLPSDHPERWSSQFKPTVFKSLSFKWMYYSCGWFPAGVSRTYFRNLDKGLRLQHKRNHFLSWFSARKCASLIRSISNINACNSWYIHCEISLCISLIETAFSLTNVHVYNAIEDSLMESRYSLKLDAVWTLSKEYPSWSNCLETDQKKLI